MNMIEATQNNGPINRTLDNIRFYGSLGREGIDERIRALEDEWDVERAVTVALSGAGVAGLVVGLLGSRVWRLLAWIALPLLFLFGQDKWKPSEGILKSLGLRSRREIQDEKYALKALRGDFRDVEPEPEESGAIKDRNSARAMEAVRE
jgi:hypothetical protein